MEQKDYKMEIMNVLLKRESHGREIAKSVGTNSMTALRKIGELREMNVIDFREEGKNKVYFIKKSDEARNYLFILEYYKLLKALQRYSVLRNIIGKIQNDKRLDVVILFGSYAKGVAKKESDIDIFVETEDRKIKNEIEKINSKLSVKIGSLNDSSLLLEEIEKNHIIIKGVERYYERIGFFEKE